MCLMRKIRPDSETAILTAAFELFAENPGASLADVAARAGVGRATLHRYFPSRSDLIVAMAKTAHDELDAAVSAAVEPATSYGEGLRLALEAIIPLAERQMFLTSEPLAQNPDLADRFARDLKALEQDIAQAKAEGVFAPELPDAWIAQSYEALIFAGWSMVRAGQSTPAQAAQLAWRTLTKGTGA